MSQCPVCQCAHTTLLEAEALLGAVGSHPSWRAFVLQRPMKLARLEVALGVVGAMMAEFDGNPLEPAEALGRAEVVRDSARRLLDEVEGWQPSQAS